jgi:hypothetical protein
LGLRGLPAVPGGSERGGQDTVGKVKLPTKKCIVCRTKSRAGPFYCLDCTRDWFKQPKDTFEPRWAVERALKIERVRRRKTDGA